MSALQLAPPFHEDAGRAIPSLVGESRIIKRRDSSAPIEGLTLARRPEGSLAELVDGAFVPDLRGVYEVAVPGVLLRIVAVERAWAEQNMYVAWAFVVQDRANAYRRSVPGHWDRLRALVADAPDGELAHYEKTGERPVTWSQGNPNPSGRSGQ